MTEQKPYLWFQGQQAGEQAAYDLAKALDIGNKEAVRQLVQRRRGAESFDDPWSQGYLAGYRGALRRLVTPEDLARWQAAGLAPSSPSSPSSASTPSTTSTEARS